MLVAVAAPAVLGESLAGPDIVAVALIVAGIFIIGLAGAGARVRTGHAILLSLATGVTIALYTLIDAAGARSGPSPHTYSVWLFVLSASALLLVAACLRRSASLTLLRPHLRHGAFLGVMSALAYMVILWAMTVAPAALVAAVRETSILFAALIGWSFLGEKVSRLRWFGVGLTVIGLVAARY
jgi:drug/metabolite transporter (DMT)-like permease